MSQSRKSQQEGSVSVVLEGGLGNQLFMLFAGLYLAHKTEVSLMAYPPEFSKAYNIHQSSVKKFTFSEKVEFHDHKFQPKLIHKLATNTNRVFPLLTQATNRITKYYQSPINGYDDNLRILCRNTTLKGYFQTYYFAEQFLSNNKYFRIELQNPSSQFLKIHQILQKSRNIMIHIRLGDYLNSPKDIGNLSAEYYRNAFKEIDWKGRQIVVFSDDIDKAKFKVQDFLPIETLWLGSSDLCAEEALAIMWLGETFLLSNSTFGYWGAMLANSPSQVFAPKPWFRSGKDPERLLPKNWIPLNSIWD